MDYTDQESRKVEDYCQLRMVHARSARPARNVHFFREISTRALTAVKVHRLLASSLFACLAACDLAEGVTVQELPDLDRSSVEARLGLPEVAGPWRFAGWELTEGDTLGLEEELPTFGLLNIEVQRRDSLAGTYLAPGAGEAALEGEVRRDSVVAAVVLPAGGEGRFLVGRLESDTLWLEASTLVEPGSWRDGARPAFVRSEEPITPFRRVRGMFIPPPPVTDSLPLSIPDSMRTPADSAAQVEAEPAPTPTNVQPSPPPPTPADTQPSQAAEPQPPEPQPSGQPAVPRREPPRLLGVPIERDSGG